MVQIVIVLIIIGIVWYVKSLFDKHSENSTSTRQAVGRKSEAGLSSDRKNSSSVKDATEKTEYHNKYEGMDHHQMLLAVADELGIQIEQDTDEENIFNLEYQGEKFSVGCSNDSHYITIYDISWYSAETADIENFSLLRKAVNACNFQHLSTVIYSIDEETGMVNLSTRQACLFDSFIPDLKEYFRSRLEDSFRQHHNFFSRMEELRKEQFAK